ncbi:cold shock domain-containing protein [Vibrio paucivorans]|uniref:Cold shock domain-containing protein n=1 Tax=Vibrio paucivorans TaxID=2829489 RepID=A0A9X3HQQ8_9VIBR|nr:cold shock domain-containing protein [Vibrio paucivorans]MCW8333414.1 cold shock domain-containing protein [Vibrio paucivorans]
MSIKGTITEKYLDKGYGYITPAKGSLRIRFEFSDIKGSKEQLELNEEVIFVIAKDDKGHSQAIEIERLRHFHISLIVAIWFAFALAGCVWYFNYPSQVLVYYSVLNSLVLLVCWLDKRAIQKEKPTTSDSSYLFLSFLGGWVSAILFHHIWRLKKKSVVYKLLFFIVVSIQIIIVGWTLTPRGEAWLVAFIETLPPLPF